jgi:hypothetical protein
LRDLHVSHESEIKSLIVVVVRLKNCRAAQLFSNSSWKAHDGIRTRDLFLTKEVLYRLSYMGIRAMLEQSIKNTAKKFAPRFNSLKNLERETGLEPATPSLEGSRSTN